MHSYYQIAGWIPEDAIWQIGIGILGILGTIFGYYVGRRNEREKERQESDQRRVEFVAWIKGWKFEFQKKVMAPHGWFPNSPTFVQGLPEFVTNCELIRVELPEDRREKFDTLVAYISKCGHRDFDSGEDRYKKLCDSFDELVGIVRP